MRDGELIPMPHYIRGLPFLHISSFPENWTGTILVLSAYGLGDTVNSLGLQRYFMEIYPKAQSVLFAHHKWKDLIERSPFPSRYYADFWGLEKNRDLPAPPFPNAIKALKRFCRANPNISIGFADIEDPTRFARGERHTETVLRMVGVADFTRIKPFVPLKECDWEHARSFLKERGISPGGYCVMAPEASSSKKEWGEDHFFSLSGEIYKKSGLPTLFLGQKDPPCPYSTPDAIAAKGVPLPVASALIAMSNCFIGNDSGPAHIASSFDIPVFTINMESGIIPFEVRPLSQYATQIISFSGRKKGTPPVETVLWTTLPSIQQTSVVLNPSCFACGKPMRHVLEASPSFIHRMCFCGARQLDALDSRELCQNRREKKGESGGSNTGNVKELRLPSFREDLDLFRSLLSDCSGQGRLISIKYDFPVHDPFRKAPAFQEHEQGNIVWSFDSVLRYFERMGFSLVSLEQGKDDAQQVLLFESQAKKLFPLAVPWGGKKLYTHDSRVYLKYFAWNSWSQSQKLVDLLKSDWNPSAWKDAFWVGYAIFRYSPNLKNFLRWQRVFLKLLLLSNVYRRKRSMNNLGEKNPSCL